MPSAAHDAVPGGGAAASPNASAADWFDGEGFDQTDGFGDERGDLARNVRPKIDAGACVERAARSQALKQLQRTWAEALLQTTETSQSSCC